jgi:alpha-1,3-mannosyltransferase
MKVLQVVRQYNPSVGGMETYVSDLCGQLRHRGHYTDVATLNYLFYRDLPLSSFERIGDTDVFRLPSIGNPRFFLARKILKILPEYDLVHVHGVDSFIDLLAFSRRFHHKPLVLTTHGGFFHTDKFKALKDLYFKTITRRTLRRVDGVIANSSHDQQLFSPIASRLTMIETGIDCSVFENVKKCINKNSILSVGRISKNKRVDRLILTFARVLEYKPDATLTLVGQDWEGLGPGLSELTRDLGIEDSVKFMGELPKAAMLDELSHAQLFISASEYEAFGLSVIEAMATGTVPVLNDIEAFHEFIEDGVNGFLTDFNDVEVAANKIVAALDITDDDLAAISKQARLIASQYNWSNVIERIEQVYEEALKAGNLRRKWRNPS